MFFSLAAGGLLLVGLFLLLSRIPQIAHADSDNLFVTPGGAGDCSQATPCDLQTALSTASNGDTIFIAEGTYTGTDVAVITITQSIALYGGWDGTTTTPPVRDPDAYPTTLDGEGALRRGLTGAARAVSLPARWTGDPTFVDAEGGDYHIGPGSAAIDAGGGCWGDRRH